MLLRRYAAILLRPFRHIRHHALMPMLRCRYFFACRYDAIIAAFIIDIAIFAAASLSLRLRCCHIAS